MLICVNYEETCYNSEHEGGSYGSWSEDYSSSITDVYEINDKDSRPYSSETFLVPDGTEEVFVVYMIYSTGDSFGRATGKIDVLHCTSNEEAAHELAKKITDNPDEYAIKFVDDFGRDISLYNNGAGYFERISYVEVERFSVGKGAKKRRYSVKGY